MKNQFPISGGIFRSGLALALVTFAWGCNPSNGAKAPTGTRTSTQTNTNTKGGGGASLAKVSYLGWVKSYLDKTCVSCHGSGDEYDLSTYAKAKEQADAILAAMEAGTMPQGGPKATSDQISKVKSWIAGGRLEKDATSSGNGTNSSTNTRTGTGTGTGTGNLNLTWTRDIAPLFTSSCGTGSGSCHGSSSRFGDLSTLNSAKSRSGQIQTRVQNGTMPPQGGLAAQDKQKIINWIGQGMN